MKYVNFSFLFLVSTLLSNDEQTFKMEDGSKIVGTIMSEDDSIFEIETTLGIVQIEKRDIKTMMKIGNPSNPVCHVGEAIYLLFSKRLPKNFDMNDIE